MARRLRLVTPEEELSGVAPVPLERAAKACSVGDAQHRGLIFTSAALSRYGIQRCTPPGAREPALVALECAEAWARDQAALRAVKKTRAESFSAAGAVEQRTIEAVRASLTQLERAPKTELDTHADRTVLRYAGLAASYSHTAVLLVLDGIEAPEKLSLVPQQVAGAIAYQLTGLGAARSPQFRARALDQAQWEHERAQSRDVHELHSLALQVFHEFLGSRWKAQQDEERLYCEAFALWALQAS